MRLQESLEVFDNVGESSARLTRQGGTLRASSGDNVWQHGLDFHHNLVWESGVLLALLEDFREVGEEICFAVSFDSEKPDLVDAYLAASSSSPPSQEE